MSDLYYTAPSNECFEELRKAALKIWQQYDNANGYADEKVNAIKNLENISDNFMYMVAMFDSVNQSILARMLSNKTKKEIADRYKDGGAPDEFNFFL